MPLPLPEAESAHARSLAESAPIWVIGSINTDMVVRTAKLPRPGETVLGGDFVTTAGGKGANQAVAAARLGGHVSLVARVGTDVFGDQALARLHDDRIDCDCVARDTNLPSGVALISVDEGGNNQIVVAPGANNTLGLPQVDAALPLMADAAVVLLQLEIPFATVSHAIDRLAGQGRRVILDPAPARDLPESVLAGVYLVTPNETEAEMLTGVPVVDERTAQAAATRLLGMGVQNVAITLGAQGVYLATPSRSDLIPTPAVTAVDTTAAGDCFNGALAVGLAANLSLHESVGRACQIASMSVTRRGAQDSMPYAHEVLGGSPAGGYP
jgi:ribokinase